MYERKDILKKNNGSYRCLFRSFLSIQSYKLLSMPGNFLHSNEVYNAIILYRIKHDTPLQISIAG